MSLTLVALGAINAAYATDPTFADICTSAQSAFLTFLQTAAPPILGVLLVAGGWKLLKRTIKGGIR